MELSYYWSSEENEILWLVGLVALIEQTGWISLYVTSLIKYVQFMCSKIGPKTS